jgi:subtilisin family serine protease
MKRLRCAILGAAVIILSSTHRSTLAEGGHDPTSAIVVSLDGGIPVRNMGQILSALAQHLGGAFLTHSVNVQNTICDTLAALGYPPWCEDFSVMINELNGKDFFKSKFAENWGVTVPDIKIERLLRKRRTEDATDIAKNWQHLGAGVNVPRPDAVPVLTYQGYRFTLKVPDDQIAVDTAVYLSMLGIDNVQVEPVLSRTRRPTLYFSNNNEIEQRCRTSDPYNYPSLNYQDLSEVVDQPERTQLDSQLGQLAKAKIQPEKVVVSLIDTPLEFSPNLDVNKPPASNWTCVWEDFADRDHATHLAGIIGSLANGFGFVGLVQNVKWDAFAWSQPGRDGKLKVIDDASKNLADFLNDRADPNADSVNLRVFVAALSFDPYPPGLLDQHPERRFTFGVLANAIRSLSGLVVVAAGQADPTAQPPIQRQPVSTTSPLLPQDLGDLENVIIVTACEICTRATPRLLSDANFSQGDRPYIHVAAPGGKPVPGWITDHSIGAQNGTSQAAAYVAGEAAAMISYYPRFYPNARTLKRRIQVTSWPLPQDDDSAQQLAAGLVDPVLALYDPTKHWSKTGGRWEVLPVKSANSASFQYDTGALAGNFVNSAIMRILKISDRNWILYVDSARYQSGRGNRPIGIKGEITMVSGVYPTKNATITTCDEHEHNLSEYEDIIFATGGADASCP